MKSYFYYICMVLCLCSGRIFSQEMVVGRVLAQKDSLPLKGAVVMLASSKQEVFTSHEGAFKLAAGIGLQKLVVKLMGYETQTFELLVPTKTEVVFYLQDVAFALDEVVLNTGYQLVSKQKATGSFFQVEEKLFNRDVGSNFLARLENVVPGLTFNKTKGAGSNNIAIRGQSTIFANTQPLIVLDNFPYEGNVESINPNDIESVTVLKDAAAAAIWGARAGNGVIVINTKSGKFNTPTQVSLRSNFSFAQKQQPYYLQQLSSTDFIDVELGLFEKGFYNSLENVLTRAAASPVVELLFAKRKGLISASDVEGQIAALRGFDVRQEFNRYLFQAEGSAQHNLQVRGGDDKHNFYLSAGFDQNKGTLKGNAWQRFSLNANSVFKLTKRFTLSSIINLNKNRSTMNGLDPNGILMSSGISLYPYARLADEMGNPLAINYTYRADYVKQVEALGLLNWQYYSLLEQQQNNNVLDELGLRAATKLRYDFSNDLNGELSYQYGNIAANRVDDKDEKSWFVRDLVNQYTQVNAGGGFEYPIPLGAIRDRYSNLYQSHNLRGQLNFAKVFGRHGVNGLAGYEMGEVSNDNSRYRWYGYDPEHATFKAVNYVNSFKRYQYPASVGFIPFYDTNAELVDRSVHYFTSLGYDLDKKYFLSLSGRVDKSNIFGVNTNQKGVPLWSAGLAWNMAKEDFFRSKEIENLKFRFTYGYNGNVDKRVTALTTARYYNGIGTQTALPYATVINPPNPSLRWEKVKVLNAGVDFGLKNNWLSGSIEYYFKNGIDLIGDSPISPTAGILSYRGNTAATKTHGVDVNLSSINLSGRLKWQTDALFSHVQDKVTGYNVVDGATFYVQYADAQSYPLLGKPVMGLYSYDFAGLDPLTGDPMGYLNGVPSKEYGKIIGAADVNNIIYHGSARPTFFGALRNSLSYGNFSLTLNMSYRFGYYFRQNSVRYGSILSANGGHGDFAKRWRKPGDEEFTSVPSMPSALNVSRDNLYLFSKGLVHRADHIRLQDIRVDYFITTGAKTVQRKGSVSLYLMGSNLGLLWRANGVNMDPDYLTVAPTKLFSVGLNANF